MTGWLITALIVICVVLAVMCAGLIWHVREQRAEIDLLTRHLIGVLDRSRKALLNHSCDAHELPRGPGP